MYVEYLTKMWVGKPHHFLRVVDYVTINDVFKDGKNFEINYLEEI